MTDVNLVAKSYIDLWNERAPQRRREMLASNWTSDARYVDPLMAGDGHDGVDALIAGVQQTLSGFQLQADRRAQRLRRSRRASPGGSAPRAPTAPIKGTDFAVLKDGRIRSITGFLDQVPPGA